MKRPCDVCGTTYEAKRATSRYCSSACRVRKARGAQVVDLPGDEPDTPPIGACYAATLQTLVDAGREGHPMGAAALALARRIDSPGSDTGSALASAVGRLETALAAATRGAGKSSAPEVLQDELAARRARQGA